VRGELQSRQRFPIYREGTVLIEERDAARFLGLSVFTLRRRRLLRQPPNWVKLGARVLYKKKDLESLIDASVVHVPTADGKDTR
jgi:hypothetical protein